MAINAGGKSLSLKYFLEKNKNDFLKNMQIIEAGNLSSILSYYHEFNTLTNIATMKLIISFTLPSTVHSYLQHQHPETTLTKCLSWQTNCTV